MFPPRLSLLTLLTLLTLITETKTILSGGSGGGRRRLEHVAADGSRGQR